MSYTLSLDHLNQGSPGISNKRFVGQIIDVKDPLKLGRVRVMIPELWDGLPHEHIPWSTIERSVHQGADSGAGYYGIPQLNSHVYVKFDNNDEHSPVITGEPLPSKLTPNEMDPDHYGHRDPAGNIFDVNNKTNDINITTHKGTRIFISGADGSIEITTNERITFRCKNNDINVSETYSLHAKTDNTNIDEDYNLHALRNITLTAKEDFTINCRRLFINATTVTMSHRFW